MEIKTLIKTSLASLSALATVGVTVLAQRGAQQAAECVAKPAAGLSAEGVLQGITFIAAGGSAPVVLLVLAFVVGLIVSHVLWGGF